MLTIKIDIDMSPWDIEEYVMVLTALRDARLKAFAEFEEEQRLSQIIQGKTND